MRTGWKQRGERAGSRWTAGEFRGEGGGKMRRRAGWVGVALLGIGSLALLNGPKPASAQGWVEPRGPINGFAVEKTRSEVAVRIEGRVAVVEVSEWFRNGGLRVAEGEYLYPLPGEAVFQGFSLFQGEVELRGEIMDAGAARAIYEEIVRRRADPALIELAGQGLLRARVFPIEPGQERKVTLRYTQVLSRAGDALQFAYAGGVRRAWESARPAVLGNDGVRSPVLASGETHFRVVVADGESVLDPFSPTHAIRTEREGGRLVIELDEPSLMGRLALFLPLARDRVGLSVATHRPPGEDGYFMLTLSPGREPGRAEPRDVTVVVDVSGSMSGEKIEQARAALHGLLGTLSGDDRFRLLAFSNAVRMEREGWAPVNRRSIRRARAWVDRLTADGGTNIEGALREAFRPDQPEDRLPMVIFVTDGLPSVGENNPERLADRAEAEAGRARVFAFGIGHDVNTHLLDRLGEAGRGSTGYVQPGEDVERALGLLATKIRHPVLTDLEIQGAPVRFEEIHPVRLPDLFAGEELILFGRYKGDGRGEVRIRGRRGGRAPTFGVVAAFPQSHEANEFIPRLWASRKLGHLMRQIWTEGETPGLVEEIRSVALRYGLPSPYTSYLVQEPEILADRVSLPHGARTFVAPHRQTQGTSPTAAVGSGAVRQAEEARRLRDAASVQKLAAMEAEMMDRMVEGTPAGELRSAGGRIFALEDGVWTDAAYRDGDERIRVAVFSPAYFRVVAALDEVRRIAGELTPVVVAGAEVSLEIGPEGLEDLTDGELEELVRRFRGAGDGPRGKW
ncbi:MAG: VWA domain-containing protein [Gemmatimonadales bacterium]|nr:MAG: VWA domain-containing protein [Gemmatimonadales bacterium]